MTIAIFLESGQVEMVVNRFLNIVIMLLLSVLLANCSETQFIANLMKVGADKVAQPGGGRYKVGGPYQIKGIWYRPRIDYQYDQTGIASWYGPQFHGKLTANGEIFDMLTRQQFLAIGCFGGSYSPSLSTARLIGESSPLSFFVQSNSLTFCIQAPWDN